MSTKKFYRVIGDQDPLGRKFDGPFHHYPLGSVVAGSIDPSHVTPGVLKATNQGGIKQTLYPCHYQEVRQYRVTGNTLAGRVYHRFPIGTLVYGSGDDCSDINGQWQIIFPEHLEEVTDE